jgi:uncharacterized protein
MTAPASRALRSTAVLVAGLLVVASGGARLAAQQSSAPELTGPVNDFAAVLRPEHKAELESLSRKLQEATGDVLVVATVKTFQPSADLRSYANEMFENRGKGIGQKGRDNGLLLVLAIDDRSVWTEVGYDLEGIITDGFAGQTSRETMAAYFRKGDYGGGLIAGATRFAQRIAQARGVTLDGVRSTPVRRGDDDTRIPLILLLFLAIVAINIIRAGLNVMGMGRRRRRGRRWTSGVGPFGAGYGGWSGGSSWGGDSWGGGGGFGGGFGGFGGGRSGGGGGGASW